MTFSKSLVALVAAVAFTSAANAQDAHNHAGHDHAGHDHAHGESIAFRLADWKEMHFDDAAKADAHVAAVKRLGCEVKKAGHDGHIDVVYRCTDWTKVEVKSHQLAEQWQTWLMNSGFDTHHGDVDPSFTEGAEVVEFRAKDWQTLHGDANSDRMIATLRKVGADVRVERHGNHSDVSYRCPVWSDIHLTDHDNAEKWMAWLKGNGFEVRHAH